MDPDRRRFLAGGLAAGLGGFLVAGRAADGVKDEVARRLRYLSPPDGIPYDPVFGVPFRSPYATPFKNDLFIPPVAVAEIDMTGPDWPEALPREKWQKQFADRFAVLVDKFKRRGVQLGSPPVPDAHQRFWEFRPKKFYVLREREVARRYHSEYGEKPNTWTWCYESLCADGEYHATSPGPTIRARYGEPILVRRINDLPEIGNHSVGANVKFGLPSTTTHLHNAHTASESDGNPDDFINPGEYWDHHYGNFPSGFDDREKLTTLWYHDHRMDYTAANIYAGLDGMYHLFDERTTTDGKAVPADQMQDVGSETETEGWRLPFGKGGEFDVPLVLHDLLFRKDDAGVPQLVFDGYNSDGVLGDQYTVNRVIRPRLRVKRRKYRFRLLNAGPSRFYEVSLHTRRDGGHRQDTPAADPFVVITGDGNFQVSPLAADGIHLGVAQRVDVILDFSKFQDGDRVYLVNRLRQIKGQGATGELVPLPPDGAPQKAVDDFFNDHAVMRFDVGPAAADESRIRLLYRPLPTIDLTEVVRERTWRFDHDGGLWTVNGRIFDGNRIDAGIEEQTAEVWTLRNEGNGWQHPIHSHFTEFIILEIDGRPQYQTDVQTGQVVHRGDSFRRTLLDERHLREHFERRFRKTGPLKGADPRLIERINMGRKGDAKLVADRAEPLTKDQVAESARTAADFYRGMSLVSVAEFLAEADKLYQETGIELRIPRFFGGPRRDVALLLPGTEMKVFMRWRDFRGKYVMHCHNVVHEDHAMMVRWDILPRGKGFDTPRRDRPTPGRPTDRPFAEPHPGQTAPQSQTIPIEPRPHNQERPR